MATRKRHSPEQVVRKLATADRMLSEDKDVAGSPNIAVAFRQSIGPSMPDLIQTTSYGIRPTNDQRLKDCNASRAEPRIINGGREF